MAAIIFDFDGTICDSFDYVADFLAGEAQLAPLDESQKQALRGLPMLTMARRLGHSWLHMPWLFLKGRRQMGHFVTRLKLFSGMEAVLRKLHAEGQELFIVSANNTSNVQAFLRHHELEAYFVEVYGKAGSFGKASVLRRLLRDHALELKNAVYIGDELRDVEAAQSINLRVIAVTWGFARPADLKALQPTAVVHTPGELLNVLEEL